MTTMATARETPQEKAVRLVEDDCVIETDINIYTVRSGENVYTVTNGRCNCIAANYGNDRCAHRLAAELFRSARD